MKLLENGDQIFIETLMMRTLTLYKFDYDYMLNFHY